MNAKTRAHDLGKSGGGGKRKAALPLPSFLSFYFRFRAFSTSGPDYLGAGYK